MENSDKKPAQEPLVDAIGSPLEELCRIEKLRDGSCDTFFVKTKSLLQMIEREELWDVMIDSLTKVKPDYILNKTLESERIGMTHEIPMEKVSLIHHSHFSRDATSAGLDGGIAIKTSFFPSRLNYDNYTGERIQITPKENLVRIGEGDTSRYYRSDQVRHYMKQQDWTAQDFAWPHDIPKPKRGPHSVYFIPSNPNKYERTGIPGRMSDDRIENLFHNIDPVTLKPGGKKRSIYLNELVDDPSKHISLTNPVGNESKNQQTWLHHKIEILEVSYDNRIEGTFNVKGMNQGKKASKTAGKSESTKKEGMEM